MILGRIGLAMGCDRPDVIGLELGDAVRAALAADRALIRLERKRKQQWDKVAKLQGFADYAALHAELIRVDNERRGLLHDTSHRFTP